MKMKPGMIAMASAGALLILLDGLWFKTNAVWMFGFFLISYAFCRPLLRRMDAARAAEEQRDLEKELKAKKKKRGDLTCEQEQQKERLRRELEREQELAKLNRRQP